MYEPDKDGKFPVTNAELMAFKMLAGFSDAILTAAERLKERAQAAGVWRDLRLMETLAPKVVQEVFHTLPLRKQDAIFASWKRLRARVDEVPPMGLPGGEMQAHITVPLPALLWLLKTVIDWECLCCDKTGKAAQKCPLRERLEQTYQFELPEVVKGECPFCTMSVHDEIGKVG